jgi:hypothetical protein
VFSYQLYSQTTTTLNVELHYPKTSPRGVFGMTILSEETFLPKSWVSIYGPAESPSGLSMDALDVLSRRVMLKSCRDRRALDAKLLAPVLMPELSKAVTPQKTTSQ